MVAVPQATLPRPFLLLGATDWDPGSATTKSTPSSHSTSQDVPTASDLTVTFTPSSSRVLLVLEGSAYSGGATGDLVSTFWNVRASSADVFAQTRIFRSVNQSRERLSRVVAVTPSTPATWNWGFRSSSASFNTNLRAGGSGAPGPASMEVWEIPDGTVDLIGLTQYDPNPAETPTTSSTSFSDVDATNLAVTFTTPPSGTVLVELDAYCSVRQAWTLREGSSDVDAVGMQALQGHPHRVQVRFFFTPSAGSHTYKWGWRRVDPSTAEMYYGLDYGPAEMRVWSVET